jgi:hypothetical protein
MTTTESPTIVQCYNCKGRKQFGSGRHVWDCGICHGTGEVTAEVNAVNEARLDEYEADIMSGKVFNTRSFAASANRRVGYNSMISYDVWGKILVELGTFARSGPACAFLVAEIGLPNQFGTGRDAYAHIAEKMAAAIDKGWDDVYARTSPEPCRYSDAQKDFNLPVRLMALALLCRIDYIACNDHVGGYGLLDALLFRNRINSPKAPWKELS